MMIWILDIKNKEVLEASTRKEIDKILTSGGIYVTFKDVPPTKEEIEYYFSQFKN